MVEGGDDAAQVFGVEGSLDLLEGTDHILRPLGHEHTVARALDVVLQRTDLRTELLSDFVHGLQSLGRWSKTMAGSTPGQRGLPGRQWGMPRFPEMRICPSL